MSDSQASAVFRGFSKTISSQHAKLLSTILSENTDVSVGSSDSPWKGRGGRFRLVLSTQHSYAFIGMFRRSASTTTMSPTTLSRNFHASINMIKFNDFSTFSDEMGSSLLSKVATFQVSSRPVASTSDCY
jgi:hypothetical protein